jgi:hypothetical protein
MGAIRPPHRSPGLVFFAHDSEHAKAGKARAEAVRGMVEVVPNGALLGMAHGLGSAAQAKLEGA